jgi:hypothetical protein
MTKQFYWCALLGTAALTLSGCQKPKAARADFAMGDRVPVGAITYSVVEATWRTQLGESFKIRTPENRFLLIKVSVTNGSGKDISIPLLTLEGANGKIYHELPSGEGVDNWFGVLRTLNPAETQQGNVVFDVPLASYKIRMPDISDSGFQEDALVQIPLQMSPDVHLESPIDPNSLK